MGYDVHITRANEWWEAESAPITLDEWLLTVKADPEMRLDGFAEVTTPEGSTIRYDNQGLAVWKVWEGHHEDGNKAWFDYHRGRITVNNPDDRIIAKMKQIAERLGAKVIGDEGEEY